MGVYVGGTGSANQLDDYEEGTWTPSLSFGYNQTGISYAVNNARYTKVGNRVHVTFYFQLSSKGSSSGQARVGGLPFTSANITNFYQHGSVWINTWNGGNTVPTGYVTPNTTSFRLERQIASSSSGVNTFDNTNMNNATDVMLSLHYQVS